MDIKYNGRYGIDIPMLKSRGGQIVLTAGKEQILSVSDNEGGDLLRTHPSCFEIVKKTASKKGGLING